MIYDGRNIAMAKCYNSIKHLLKKFPLISLTRKTNSRTHCKIQTETQSSESRADSCLYREHIWGLGGQRNSNIKESDQKASK